MKIFNTYELDKKSLLTSLRNIGIAVFSLLLIAYFVYHTANGFQDKVEFEGVFYREDEKTTTLDAYLFRDEHIINSRHQGIASYSVKENEKVTDRTEIAKIYSNSANAELIDEIETLNKQIEILSAVGASSQLFTDMTHIDNAILESLSSITGYTQGGDYASAISYSDELLINLSKKQLRMNSQKNFAEYIELLKARRDSLSFALPSPIETVNSDAQGYFSKRCDGYEQFFDYEKIPTLSVSDFYEMKKNAEGAEVSDYTVGKIVSDFEWYLVCPLSHSETASFTAGKSYNITFSENMNIQMPAYLLRIVTESGEGNALLIFRCERMPENFSYLRNQKISITLSTVSGLKIPRSAVRFSDEGRTFVYIMIGGRIHVRAVEIIDEAGEYYYVKSDTEPTVINGDEAYGIKRNDNVIVYGTNLYNGKIYK